MQVAAFVATVLLLGAFVLAHDRRPTEFSELWIVGWALYGLRFVFDGAVSVLGQSYVLSVAGHEATAASAIILLLAVARLADDPVITGSQAIGLFVAVSAWILAGPLLTDDFFTVHAPMFFAFGLVHLATAFVFYRHLRTQNFASTPVIVGSLTVWALHKFDFPFLRPVEWFAPYGYALGAILALMTGVGVVMFLLEEAEREAREQQAAARRTSREYRDLFDNMTDPVYIHDEAGNFLTVNQTAVETLGYDRETFQSMTPRDIVAPEERSNVADRIDAIRDDDSITFRSVHQTKSGETFPVEVHASRIQYRGAPAVLSVARDVTEPVRREQELEKFKQASEAAGHAIYITDPECHIEYVNPAFESMTGYSAAEAIGRTPALFGEDGNPEWYDADLWERIASEGVWEAETRNYRKNGDQYHAHQTVAPITVDGDLEAFVAIQTDVSERKAQERRLRRYKQTVESSTNLLAAVDEDRQYVFANEAYRSFHAPDAERLADVRLDDVLGPAELAAMEPFLDRALRGETVSVERTRTDPSGNERTLDVQLFPLETGDGSIEGVGASMRDVTTARKRTEAIRQLSEYRRVMFSINQVLVTPDTTRDILPAVTERLADSDLFGCSFIALVDDTDTDFICTNGTDIPDDVVADFHTTEYVQDVFESGVIEMEDVTEPPYQQHDADHPSHAGVAVAISHEGENLGVLTVHYPTDVDFVGVESRLLRELAADLGLFLHSRALEQEVQTFTEIAERIDDPIMLQHRDGTFDVVNRALSEYADRPKSELIGEDESVFMDEAAVERIRSKKARTLEEERPVQYEVSPTLPGRGERTFSTVRYPHYGEDGELDGTVAICRDVTELKERERHLQVIDRVLRHNVNNSMTVVEGFAETIRDATDEEYTETYAQNIIDSSRTLVETVTKERDISKILSEPAHHERIDLVHQVESAVEAIESRPESATITTDLPAACRLTTTTKIGQAVEELIRNAVVHTDQDTAHVEISVEANQDGAAVVVADDGPGIPAMERRVLTGEADIEPLYHGSGLGLWLVNLIVNEANGTLAFDENDPRGSVVTISLPRDE